jgi:ArsR family transcriptional regulator
VSVSTEATSCVSVLKVLADETRLAVVELLINGPRHVGEMMQELKVEQSLLSHHLRVLRDARLVMAERDGKSMLYRLAPNVESAYHGKAINLGCCLLSFDQLAASSRPKP